MTLTGLGGRDLESDAEWEGWCVKSLHPYLKLGSYIFYPLSLSCNKVLICF